MRALDSRFKESALTFLALFTSIGTLLCCALPAILVTVGLGASVVGLTSALPWLIPLSRHKIWIFSISGILLALSMWLLYRRGRTCPSNPRLARLCQRIDRWNRTLVGTAIGVWVVGAFAAFALLPLRQRLGW